MKSLKEYIRIYESEEAVSSVEKNIVENPAKVTMMDVKPSPLDWRKVAKLSPEKFAEVFKDKTLVIYSPQQYMPSFGKKLFSHYAKSKKASGGNFNSIILISNIGGNHCNATEINLHYTLKKVSYWDDVPSNPDRTLNIKLEDVIDGIGIFRLKAFSGSKYQPKIFVIDGSYDIKEDSKFIDDFFKPWINVTAPIYNIYGDLLNKLEKIYSKKEISYEEWNKDVFWNYAIKFGPAKKFDGAPENRQVEIVGIKDYRTLYMNLWMGYPDLNSGSIVGHSMYNPSANKYYRISESDYKKMAEMVDITFKEILDARNKVQKFENDWIHKYVLGEPIDMKEFEEKGRKEIEDEQKKGSSDKNNDPDSGSEKIKVSKKKLADAESKMDAWHVGARKQNLRPCSDDKLKLNYKICKSKGYDKEASLIEDEAKSRGLKLTESLNESVFELVDNIKINED